MRQIQIILNKIFKKNLLSNFIVNILMGGGGGNKNQAGFTHPLWRKTLFPQRVWY